MICISDFIKIYGPLCMCSQQQFVCLFRLFIHDKLVIVCCSIDYKTYLGYFCNKMIQFLGTEDGRSMTTFYYCSVNDQSGLQSINTFSKLSCFFNVSKCAANYVIWFEVYDGFIGQKVWSYEGRNVGHSALAELPI